MKALFDSAKQPRGMRLGSVRVRPGHMARLEVGPFDEAPQFERLHVQVEGGDERDLEYISALTDDGHRYVYRFENYGQRSCRVSVVIR